jgi:hypothetical protein
MQYKVLSFSIISLFIFLIDISFTQAKDIDLCKHVGTLSAMYLDEIPQRLVIYDAEYSLEKSISVYKVDKKSPRGYDDRVGVEALDIGNSLSYKVDHRGGKRRSQISEIWILPYGYCRSSE